MSVGKDLLTDADKIGVFPDPSTALVDGTKAVALAATPEALAASTSVKAVLVQALRTNTGLVFIGNSSTQSISLSAGEGETLWIDNLSKIYIKVNVNGEGVAYHGM